MQSETNLTRTDDSSAARHILLACLLAESMVKASTLSLVEQFFSGSTTNKHPRDCLAANAPSNDQPNRIETTFSITVPRFRSTTHRHHRPQFPLLDLLHPSSRLLLSSSPHNFTSIPWRIRLPPPPPASTPTQIPAHRATLRPTGTYARRDATATRTHARETGNRSFAKTID